MNLLGLGYTYNIYNSGYNTEMISKQSTAKPGFFFGGGPIFRDLLRPTRFGGGGVVAEFFRDRRKPGRFSGRGGVVAEIFRDRRKPATFRGGGVVGIFFF